MTFLKDRIVWYSGFNPSARALRLDSVRSDTPALTIHGQMDPCCSTRWGDELSKTMPNVQSIELQGKGHNPITECRSTVVDSFLSRPYAAIDKSCRDEVALNPWQLE